MLNVVTASPLPLAGCDSGGDFQLNGGSEENNNTVKSFSSKHKKNLKNLNANVIQQQLQQQAKASPVSNPASASTGKIHLWLHK